MKRKRCLAGLLVGLLALNNAAAIYAETPVNVENTVTSDVLNSDNVNSLEYYNSLMHETNAEDAEVAAYSADDIQEEQESISNPLKSYAAESEYTVEWSGKGANGQEYVLTINTNYTYTNSTGTVVYAQGAQITNIKTDSKTVATNIEIPSDVLDKNGNQVDVISIGEVAFDSCYATDITVPGTVLEICDGAFANCPNLKTITMNCDLDDGTGKAKTYMKGTSYYALPTQLGDRVIADCPKLESAVINNYATIGSEVLAGCTALTSANITFDNIYDVSTAGKAKTTLLTIAIGDSAFKGSTALREFTVSDSVKSMGKTSFVDCTGLETVHIGTTLGANYFTYEDFTNCISLLAFTVDDANKNYSVDEFGILYNKKYTTLLVYPLAIKNTTFIIPETVTIVDTYAAMNQPYLKKLYFNYAAVNVKQGAFKGSALTDIVVADNFGCTLGDYAFADCKNLVNLDLKGWSNVGNYVFSNCTSLISVTAGLGVGAFGIGVFKGCTSLVEADLELLGLYVISTKDTTFGTNTFENCTSLVYCRLPEVLTGISSNTFLNCTSLVKVDCSDNLASIRSGAFSGCTSLETPPSPRFLVRIDSGAFSGCENLNSSNPYKISSSAKYIDKNAFVDMPYLCIQADEDSYAAKYCASNNVAVIYASDYIADEEFLLYTYTDDGIELYGYRGGFYSIDLSTVNLGSIVIASDWIKNCLADKADCRMTTYLQEMNLTRVKEIGASAFSGCTALVTADLPVGLEKIGAKAFYGCKSLLKVELPNTLFDDVTTVNGVINTVYGIGENAFSGCTSIEYVGVLNDGVSVSASTPICTLGKKAFYGCTAIKTIELPDNIGTIMEGCFQNAKSAVTLVLPLYCETIEKNAFSGCTCLQDIKFNPNLKKIGETSFANCTSLKYLTLDNAMLVQLHAFQGCVGLERVIIYANANVSVENDPFVDNTDLTIVASDASKAQTYVEYKNSTETNSFNIELAEFVEVAGKARVKCTINAPDGVVVYKLGDNGEYTLLNTATDYVIYDDVIKFEMADGTTDEYAFYVNGNICSDNTYTVEETITKIDVKIDELNKLQLGDVDGDGEIIAADAAITLQYVLNPSAVGLDAQAIVRADVDKNGIIDAYDAASILQKALNSSYEF